MTEKPGSVKLHAPHFEPHSPHHVNHFLKDLKRAQPFKQSQLYPPASTVHSLQPSDLMKMMNIELKPTKPAEAESTAAPSSPNAKKHPLFDDEEEEEVDESALTRQRQQQPSPMQVVVNYRPKQSVSEEPSQHDPIATNLEEAAFKTLHGESAAGTATSSTVLNSHGHSIAEDTESTAMEEQLYELQQVEQLANEEVLSSIAHIQQIHGPSPATTKALGAASMAVAAGSLSLARKKSSFSGTLKFDPLNRFSKSSSRRKFDKFVLGDPSHAKSRTPSKAQLMDSVAHNQKLFNWEEIDLFKVDEEDSFLLHNFKFEDDNEEVGRSIKSHTFVSAADGQKREITGALASIDEERRSSVVVHEKMLNNQIKELLQSEVVVVLEEVPIVAAEH